MDPQPPPVAGSPFPLLPTNGGGKRTSTGVRYHYAMQVHGFIEAAEVVGADPDIIEDILDGFEGIVKLEEDIEEDDLPDRYPHFEDQEDIQGVDETFDLDREYLEEASTAWSKHEIKQMMTGLKEHGKAYFINEYVIKRRIPIPRLLYAFNINLCKELREKRFKTLLYFLEVAITQELESREKLPMYNTIDDAVALIRKSKRIIILTGAGISVSCGIPDFRSRDGLYANLQRAGEYNLDDPQQMFDIHYFKENPAVFYEPPGVLNWSMSTNSWLPLSSFASQIYPSNFIPSPCHRFIKLIEEKGKLLRNYTQNIDTLETKAGVKRVIQCHGSFATATCVNCHQIYPGNAIESDILNHHVPLCKKCPPLPPPPKPCKQKKKNKKKNLSVWEQDSTDEEPDVPAYPPGIIKPGITFFGEKLSSDFDKALIDDRPLVDLLLVIGTSLKVSPVSDILSHLPHSVPQILINKTPVKHINPDIVLLGNADEVVQYLVHKLGWELPQTPGQVMEPDGALKRKRSWEAKEIHEPRRVGDSHVWLFEGAEGGKWVEDLRKQYEPSSSDMPYAAALSANVDSQSKAKKVKMN